jgi:hypothetical protein
MDEDIYRVPKSHLWIVSSSRERPLMRAWARSQPEADALAAELKRNDVEPDDAYWVEPMTQRDYDLYKSMGLLPEDA